MQQKNNLKIDGIEKMIQKCRKIFRVPENYNYYSSEDFKKAERTFIKAVIRNGNFLVEEK